MLLLRAEVGRDGLAEAQARAPCTELTVRANLLTSMCTPCSFPRKQSPKRGPGACATSLIQGSKSGSAGTGSPYHSPSGPSLPVFELGLARQMLTLFQALC